MRMFDFMLVVGIGFVAATAVVAVWCRAVELLFSKNLGFLLALAALVALALTPPIQRALIGLFF